MKCLRSTAVASGLILLCLGMCSSTLAAGQASGGSGAPSPPPLRAASSLLPGTSASVVSTINGHAETSTSEALPNGVLRLRDARFGRIVSTVASDKAGLFTFRSVDPGSYVVEIIGDDHSVLATSQILNVNAGDNVTTLVKMPFRVSGFAQRMGQQTETKALSSVLAAAASTGILTSGPLNVCVSGPCQ